MSVLLGVFALLLCFGAPIAMVLGISSMSFLAFNGDPLIIMPQRMFAGADSFTLMAIPLFIFAGEIMNKSGVTARIVKFALSAVGSLPGGLAHVTVFSNIIMAGISGSTAADVSAVGGMLIPAMDKAGYNRSYSTAINVASSTIGSIIPPSILMVIYGSITGISIGQLFVAGFIPGVLIGLCFMVMAYINARRNPEMYNGEKIAFNLSSLGSNFIAAIPALIMPIIVVGGILTGIFTASEAGAIAATYGILVGFFVYKELKIKDFKEIIINCVATTGVAMLIISFAILFSWILAMEGFPVMMADLIANFSSNGLVTFFVMIIIMLVIGCFMEVSSAAIIMVPIFMPIATSIGLNEIHFALVMVVTFVIGGVTPPVGTTGFIGAAVGKVNYNDMVKYLWPFIVCLLAITVLLALIPEICLFLPRLLG